MSAYSEINAKPPFSQRTGMIKWLVLIAGVGGILIGLLAIPNFLKQKIQSEVLNIADRLHLVVDWRNVEVTPWSLKFKRLTVEREDESASFRSDSVLIELGVSNEYPYLSPRRVRIVRPRIKLHQDGFSALDKLEKSGGGGTEDLVDTTNRNMLQLMRNISLEDAEILVLSPNSATPKLFIEGLNGSWTQRGMIDGKFEQLILGGHSLSAKTSWQMLRQRNAKWRFIAYPEDSSATASWNIHGELDKNQFWFVLKHHGLPIELRKSPPSWLASDQQPLFASRVNIILPKTPRDSFRFNTTSVLSQMKVKHPALSPGTLELAPMKFRLKGTAHASLDEIQLDESLWIFNPPKKKSTSHHLPLSISVDGKIKGFIKSPQDTKIQLGFRAIHQPCLAIKHALPLGLVPIADKFSTSGRIDVRFEMEADLSKLERFQFSFGRKDLNCRLAALDKSLSRESLAQRFRSNLRHNEVKPDDRFARLLLNYTEIDAISPHFILAATFFEDGGFYNHKGFSPAAIEHAVRTNLRAGKIELGASTISMQTAKNLFLDHERSVSRKLQESLLTWHLENELSKTKILEIYANIIEYGPGIYGIHQAADVLFSKLPKDLSLRESFFLASVLPSPVKRFRHYCTGYLSEEYNDFLNSRLRQLHKRGSVTDEILHEALITPLEFAKGKKTAFCKRYASDGLRLPSLQSAESTN